MDGSLWRSISDKVQPHLPSIDPSSSSEDEGCIEIFQRPSGLSLQLPDDGYTTSPGNSNTVIEAKPYRQSGGEPDGCADGDKEDHYKMIMTKIVSFCEKTISCSQNSNFFQKDYIGRTPEENVVEEIKEHPTVYIDLRCSSQTFTKPVNKEAMPGNSPSQVNMGTQTNWKETGKSMLLWKIRENNQRKKNINTKAVNLKSEVICGKSLESGETTNKFNCESQPASTHHSCVEFEHSKPTIERQKNNQEVSKKHRDHHLKQHQHTLKELEKCRPTKSVGQKQSAAENTDLLCDIEVSHLEPVRTLPTDIGNDGHILLIVNLSSPGIVSERGHRQRRKIDSAGIKPQIYNTIVTWLLSLVGPKSSSAIKANANVPFWVAGLQQFWTENGLALYVLAVAKKNYTQRKKDSSIHSPFYNHISRFLSETSLLTIAHWLPQLNAIMAEETHNAPICLPSCYLNSFITAKSDKKVIGRIFYLSPGFYWQTLETPGQECKGRETVQELHTEMSIMLGHKDFYQDPLVTHYTLQAIFESGLDICGLRLLYPSPEPLPDHLGCKSFLQKGDDTRRVLAIAVRGPFAHSLLKGIDRTVQHMTRQKTVVAEDGEEDSLLLFTPQHRHEVHKELCLWFSGRFVKESGKYQEESFISKVQLAQENASFLCATTKADIVLVVSPLIPPCCYGQVLSTCEHRGFIIRGLQIMLMDNDRASLLGLTSQQAQIFCTSTSQKCLVLILKKENALYHRVSLLAALTKEFKTHNLLTFLRSRGDVQTEETCLRFHTAPYSNNMYHIFASAWAVPDPSTVVLSNQKCFLDLEPDEVGVLTLCGQDMSQGLGLLHRALTQHGFELLGLKLLHALSRLQAVEVSPYEVGEKFSRSALVTLMSAPSLVCVLRRNNALSVLRKLLQRDSRVNLSILMSPTPQVASRLCALFFFEHEIISCAVEK